MTGRALVITRLSSVAMNIGTEAATMASQTGTDRARGGTAAVRKTVDRVDRRGSSWLLRPEDGIGVDLSSEDVPETTFVSIE